MLTSDERLALIRIKIERAEKHLKDFKVMRNRFMKTEPYKFVVSDDPNTGYQVYTITHLDNPPDLMGLIAGDGIHCIRSALDHLAWQLFLRGGGDPSKGKHISFPIHDDAAKYEARSVRQVEGMAQYAIDAINATKPYQGGTEELWVLHKLDIADKHRALLTSIVSVAQTTLTVNAPWHRVRGQTVGVASLGQFYFPNSGKPLKVGSVFFACKPNVYHDVSFAFDIALNEPEFIDSRPTLRVLQRLIDVVDGLITSFKPLLS